MLHKRLIESIATHVGLLDRLRNKGINWSDTLELYAVLHALQIHAQSTIDYLLHTCAVMKASVETPIRCVDELKKVGLINEYEADVLKRLIRFRNIIIHEYCVLDLERVRRVIESQGYRVVLQIVTRIHTRLQECGLLDS